MPWGQLHDVIDSPHHRLQSVLVNKVLYKTYLSYRGSITLKLTSYPSEKIGRSPFSHGGIS